MIALRLHCNTLAPVGQLSKSAGALSWTVILASVGLAALAFAVLEALRWDWVLALIATFVALDLGFRFLIRLRRLHGGPMPRWLVGVFFSRWLVEGAVVAVVLVLLLRGEL